MADGESKYSSGSYYTSTGTKLDPISDVPSGIDILDEYSNSSHDYPLTSEHRHSQYMEELKQVEEEIQTLRQVLTAKYRRQNFLKQELGLTVMNELRSGVNKGMDNLRSTEAFQKTTAVVKSAKEKTSAALSEKWSVLKQTNAFKSFEGKLGTAYSTVRGKLVRSATIGGTSVTSHPASSQPDEMHHFTDDSAEDASTPSNTGAVTTNAQSSVNNNCSNNTLQMSSLNIQEIDSDETEEFVQASESKSKSLAHQFTA